MTLPSCDMEPVEQIERQEDDQQDSREDQDRSQPAVLQLFHGRDGPSARARTTADHPDTDAVPWLSRCMEKSAPGAHTSTRYVRSPAMLTNHVRSHARTRGHQYPRDLDLARAFAAAFALLSTMSPTPIKTMPPRNATQVSRPNAVTNRPTSTSTSPSNTSKSLISNHSNGYIDCRTNQSCQ